MIERKVHAVFSVKLEDDFFYLDVILFNKVIAVFLDNL